MGRVGSIGGVKRRERTRSRPQLEALEGRAVLSHVHVAAFSPTVLTNGNPQIFENTVLANTLARELSNQHQLGTLLNTIGQTEGEPGYIPFLDRNRNGIITQSEILPLVQTYLPPHHLLRVS
jgi:hypothetical protein